MQGNYETVSLAALVARGSALDIGALILIGIIMYVDIILLSKMSS